MQGHVTLLTARSLHIHKYIHTYVRMHVCMYVYMQALTRSGSFGSNPQLSMRQRTTFRRPCVTARWRLFWALRSKSYCREPILGARWCRDLTLLLIAPRWNAFSWSQRKIQLICERHAHSLTHTHACTHAHMHARTHTRTHTCTHARTHTHTHTHTHTYWLLMKHIHVVLLNQHLHNVWVTVTRCQQQWGPSTLHEIPNRAQHAHHTTTAADIMPYTPLMKTAVQLLKCLALPNLQYKLCTYIRTYVCTYA